MSKIKHHATTKSPAKESLKEKNLASITKKIDQVNRETKYRYPKNCKTPAERKEFRRTSRQSIKRYDKALKKLKASNQRGDKKKLMEIQKEYNTLKESILA